LAAAALLVVIIAASTIGLLSPRFLSWALLRPYLLARDPRYGAGLITSGFVHADLGHLLFNLITFYSFGFNLESAVGTAQFVTLYACGLLVSNIATTLRHRDNPTYASLGASGAISAVLFASIVYFPNQRLFILPLPVPIPAPWFALGYLALTYYWSRRAKGTINHDAHLSGALTGLLFVAVARPQAYFDLLVAIMGRRA
jgi:membrane associated rhomboid family serine protease